MTVIDQMSPWGQELGETGEDTIWPGFRDILSRSDSNETPQDASDVNSAITPPPFLYIGSLETKLPSKHGVLLISLPGYIEAEDCPFDYCTYVV